MPRLPWATALHRAVGQRLQRIRTKRESAPLTQQQLADRTRGMLSRSSIANIERGRQGISLEQLMVLAEALEVEAVAILPSRNEVFGTQADLLSSLELGEQDRAWIERIREVKSGVHGDKNA